MSFFSNNPFYEMLDNATSENIPGAESDLALNLDIADLIKSKQIGAAEAATAIKKKLDNSNPNVQLLAIKLLDCCIKNGGNHFLVKVSQREIVDSMATIIRSSLTNPELKKVALTYFQNWAIAFRSKPDLYYLPNVYNELKREGHRFPAYSSSEVSGALIDTETAPEWSDSSVCERCRTPFTTFNRKHHCRNCGRTFCNDCCNKRIPIPAFGITNPERVCETCYYKISNPTYNTPKQQNQNDYVDFNDKDFYGADYIDNYNQSSNNAISSKEDDDIKRAIELSLKEAENQKKSSSHARTLIDEDQPENSDEEQEQLEKAIEASLKDIKISNNNNNNNNSIAPSNPNELLTAELETIKLFAQYMEKLSNEAPIKGYQAINDPQIQALHVQITSLQPKVMKNKSYYEEKYKKFNDIHENLVMATRLYDQMLSQRLDAARSNSMYSNLYQPTVSTPLQQPYTYNAYSLPPQPAAVAPEGTVDPQIQQPPPANYINQYPSYSTQPSVNYPQAPIQAQPQPQPPQQPPQSQPPVPGQDLSLQQPPQQPLQQPPQQPLQQIPQAPQPMMSPDMNLVNKQTMPPYGTEYAQAPINNPQYVPQQQPYLSMQPNAAPEVQQPPYAMAPAVQQQAPPPEPVEEKPLIEL